MNLQIRDSVVVIATGVVSSVIKPQYLTFGPKGLFKEFVMTYAGVFFETKVQQSFLSLCNVASFKVS